MSVTGGLGASSLDLLTPVTTALNYGVVADDGAVDVRLTYDHRVLDGGTAARGAGGGGSGDEWADPGGVERPLFAP